MKDFSSTVSIHVYVTPDLFIFIKLNIKINQTTSLEIGQSDNRKKEKKNLNDLVKPDDRRTKEALEVAATGELETRDEFFGDGGTANEVAALKDGDGEA